MKIAMNIDVDRLQQEINKAESTQTFKNQSELFQYLANTDWAKNQRKPFSAAVLYLRYKQNGLTLKTPKGKKGRAAGTSVNRTSRCDKLKNHPKFKENLKLLRENNPGNEKLIERVMGGSTNALIKLTCLNCSGGSKEFAKECQVTSCPVYLFSPYVKAGLNKSNKTDEESDE